MARETCKLVIGKTVVLKARYIPGLISIAVLLLLLPGCRKQFQATPLDITTYGWELYEAGKYLESYEWFTEAVLVDSAYKDGYNGLGWSLGKLTDVDSSIYYFNLGLQYTQDRNIVADVHNEQLAGLCFAWHAFGNDSMTIFFGDSLLNRVTQFLETDWIFSHDTSLTHLDIRITLAQATFARVEFLDCLTHVNAVLAVVSPGETFEPDYTLVSGRRELADRIEELALLVSAP